LNSKEVTSQYKSLHGGIGRGLGVTTSLGRRQALLLAPRNAPRVTRLYSRVHKHPNPNRCLALQQKQVKHTFWSSLVSMRLHGNMRVQVIERAICLLTTLPTTLVHSLNFFISTPGALVLLGTRNGNEGIDLLERVRYMTRDEGQTR